VKVVLDENVPHDLRLFLAHHETFTVFHMRWGGVKNGKLLEAAERAGFDVLITGTRHLSTNKTSHIAELPLWPFQPSTGQ
jgi:hypothetical protein